MRAEGDQDVVRVASGFDSRQLPVSSRVVPVQSICTLLDSRPVLHGPQSHDLESDGLVTAYGKDKHAPRDVALIRATCLDRVRLADAAELPGRRSPGVRSRTS